MVIPKVLADLLVVVTCSGHVGSREWELEEKVLNSISSQGTHARVTCYSSYCSLIKTGQTNVDTFSIFDLKKSYQPLFLYSFQKRLFLVFFEI